MGREMRNGVRAHGLFILTEKIFQMCRDVDGLSFLTSAKTGRWGKLRRGRTVLEGREEGKDERGAHGRIEE